MGTDINVGQYLLIRLKELGIGHLFGVPGDYVLGFLDQVLASEVEFVGTCNELNAAYAADGYARIRGLGAFCTTYGVGELSALNGVAGAFAERVPVVAITGAPATRFFAARSLLHHTLGDYEIPGRIYAQVTVASTRLLSGGTAGAEIDRVLSACLRHSAPVYICLPADVALMPCPRPAPFILPVLESADKAALAESVSEGLGLLDHASRPVAIGGMELMRFKLQKDFAAFLDRSGLPYATMMLGKSVLSERRPGFIGLFEGDRSRAGVLSRIETADCVLQFGALMSDLNTGGFTAGLDDERTIRANMDGVSIGHHRYQGVHLGDFLAGLTRGARPREASTLDIVPASGACAHRSTRPFLAERSAPLTTGRFFDRISHFLRPASVVIADTGVSLFAAAETLLPEGATFIAQAFYGSIGYALPAALGAGMAAPGRPLDLFIGDGAFQVTCQELSTLIRKGLQARVFLLNNAGYTIERMIVDRAYDDLQAWKYHLLPEVFGGGAAFDVRTEGELDLALVAAGEAKGLALLEIHADPLDGPESLRRAGHSMAVANLLTAAGGPPAGGRTASPGGE